MPERPDLEYVVEVLAAQVTGLVVTELVVRKPVVLRVAVPGDPAELVTGRCIGAPVRRGHFVRFSLGGREPALDLVVSPMLAGVFDLQPREARVYADTAVVLRLEDGRDLRYRDSKQMGKVYLVPGGEERQVPGMEKRGLDVLDPDAFTRDAFLPLARKRRDQVRVFLMDKGALDSLGNAYADEVLFEAGIHPKAWTRGLSEEELERLYLALPRVLGEAVATIRARKPPLATKLRDFVKVRGRAGQPCLRCGTKLRKAGVRGYDAHFCPTCQPDHRGTGLVDWRRTRR